MKTQVSGREFNRSMNVFRYLTLIFLLATAEARSVTDSDVQERIQKAFEEAKAALKSDPSGISSQRVLNKSRLVIDTIQPYFYSVPGALHEHSPERQEKVENVERWFKPYESFLVDLIKTLSLPEVDSNAVTDYVKFAEPSRPIESALLEVARSGTARPENAAAAYDGLFYLGLDSPEVRMEVVESLKWINERDSRANL